jgi:hypothetical protein
MGMPAITDTYEAFTVLVDEFNARVAKLVPSAEAEVEKAEIALSAYTAEHGDIEHDNLVGVALSDRHEVAEWVLHELQHGIAGLASSAEGAGRERLEKQLRAVSAAVAKHL